MDQAAEFRLLKTTVDRLVLRVEALEGRTAPRLSPALSAAAPNDDGPQVLTGTALRAAGYPGVKFPGSDFTMPNEAELERLYQIALNAWPQLGPKSGTSLERAGSEHFTDFAAAFRFIATLYRTPKVDPRRNVTNWLDIYESVPSAERDGYGSTSIPTSAFVLASIAHGDVAVLLTPDHMTGSAFALSVHVGEPARDGWRAVLASGKPTEAIGEGAYNRSGQLERFAHAAA